MPTRTDVIVIGAGAAGLMCAAEAGKRGRSVQVLEHSEHIGNKIRISGGGRCNFTNRYVGPGNFISQNPDFCRSALARFTPQDFMALLGKHGVASHEETCGRLFCDHGSHEIIRVLEAECQAARVTIQLRCNVSEVQRTDRFHVYTNRGGFESQSLVIATGGLSVPKAGASAFGYDLAKRFGLPVVACRPGLVPLTWNRNDLETFKELAGVSLDAVVGCGLHDFHDRILFTHQGLSGPAILQVSTYWGTRSPILLDVLPGRDLLAELTEARRSRTELSSLLARYLPRRFVEKWCHRIIEPKPLSQCSDREMEAISTQLHRWLVTPNGTEGYDKAEVTAGGVDTAEVSSKTMESRKVPGLYFVGEVMDVTGQLGGYNLQWAWSSGFAAGQFA